MRRLETKEAGGKVPSYVAGRLQHQSRYHLPVYGSRVWVRLKKSEWTHRWSLGQEQAPEAVYIEDHSLQLLSLTWQESGKPRDSTCDESVPAPIPFLLWQWWLQSTGLTTSPVASGQLWLHYSNLQHLLSPRVWLPLGGSCSLVSELDYFVSSEEYRGIHPQKGIFLTFWHSLREKLVSGRGPQSSNPLESNYIFWEAVNSVCMRLWLFASTLLILALWSSKSVYSYL